MIFYREAPISSRVGGSQMRQIITRVLSGRLCLRTYQEYFMNSSGYIHYVMNFISLLNELSTVIKLHILIFNFNGVILRP